MEEEEQEHALLLMPWTFDDLNDNVDTYQQGRGQGPIRSKGRSPKWVTWDPRLRPEKAQRALRGAKTGPEEGPEEVRKMLSPPPQNLATALPTSQSNLSDPVVSCQSVDAFRAEDLGGVIDYMLEKRVPVESLTNTDT